MSKELNQRMLEWGEDIKRSLDYLNGYKTSKDYTIDSQNVRDNYQKELEFYQSIRLFNSKKEASKFLMNGGIVYHRYGKREQFYFFDETSASVLKSYMKLVNSNEDFFYYQPILDYSNSKIDIDVIYRLENNI